MHKEGRIKVLDILISIIFQIYTISLFQVEITEYIQILHNLHHKGNVKRFHQMEQYYQQFQPNIKILIHGALKVRQLVH
jgi:hypothetical protein